MPTVQLEISADGFEVTQNSVKFLPHGIQFTVKLPECQKCASALNNPSNKKGELDNDQLMEEDGEPIEVK